MTTSLSDSGLLFADGSLQSTAGVPFKEIAHFNDVVNGNFVIAQAGTSFPAALNATYDLDGWLNSNNATTAVFTIAQVAGSTAGRLARQATITTADATVTAGKYVSDITRIEGYNIEKYVGNTFTVGFRAKVPVAGIHCVAVRNFQGDRSYIAEINFLAANVFQNCSFTIIGGLPTGGTWNYVNGSGLELWFSHMVGTTFQTAPNAWQTGSFLGTANQVNDCGTINNIWALEKVTLNLGTVAIVSEISYEQELIRCQRYFQRRMQVVTTTSSFTTIQLSPFMRATPTIGAVTFDAGTGATFLNVSFAETNSAIYQAANHSQPAQALIPLSARL